MHTIAVTPVDTGGFLDESKISTTNIHPQQFRKKPKRLVFATMRASLSSSAEATAKTEPVKPPPEEDPLYASKVVVLTFSSWVNAAHAVNGFYKSITYSCESRWQTRRGVASAGEYVPGTASMCSHASKKRKSDTEWLIGKGGKLSIVRRRPNRWKFENIKDYINVELADSVKEVKIPVFKSEAENFDDLPDLMED